MAEYNPSADQLVRYFVMEAARSYARFEKLSRRIDTHLEQLTDAEPGDVREDIRELAREMYGDDLDEEIVDEFLAKQMSGLFDRFS